MVYKDIGKPPYMQIAPDNTGLYYDMMKRAVEKIGFQLKVIRLPKTRTYTMLEHGNVDLYASGEFRDYRSEFLYYFENGLYRYERYYGLTDIHVPELRSLSEIKDYNLIWMLELGSSWPLQAKSLGVTYSGIKNAGIETAIKFFRSGRPVFFKIIQDELDDYEDKNNISLETLGIRVHKNCCETKKAKLYTCFSRSSPHYEEQPNPSYEKDAPLSAENFPFQPVPGSVPGKLKIALQAMIDSGEIAELKKRYSVE